MSISLKPLQNQVIVITGASSGIGLVTARMAAQKNVKLVLAARNEDALRQLVDEINSKGGQAIYVVADVGCEEDVNRIAEAAIAPRETERTTHFIGLAMACTREERIRDGFARIAYM